LLTRKTLRSERAGVVGRPADLSVRQSADLLSLWDRLIGR
jgi:hypothetical protein